MILIPTQFEQEMLIPMLGQAGLDDVPVQLCGFGPIAAAARTSQIIANFHPTTLTLIGIAGCYPGNVQPGSAIVFRSVTCYGIGAGTGAEFQTAAQLGWPQWGQSGPTVADHLPLELPESFDGGQLLTVCAAAAAPNDVAMRREAFPDAVAEDMEGFGVAMACFLADIPLTIVRGISNVAGDRDKSNWNIREALQAAVELAQQLLIK